MTSWVYQPKKSSFSYPWKMDAWSHRETKNDRFSSPKWFDENEERMRFAILSRFNPSVKLGQIKMFLSFENGHILPNSNSICEEKPFLVWLWPYEHLKRFNDEFVFDTLMTVYPCAKCACHSRVNRTGATQTPLDLGVGDLGQKCNSFVPHFLVYSKCPPPKEVLICKLHCRK